MKVYKLKRDAENYYSLIIKNTELGSKMPSYSPRFDAKSRAHEWVKPAAAYYASSSYKSKAVNIPDISTWVTGNLVLNEKAYSILKSMIDSSGEFLPVSIEGIDYYVFNTLKVIDDTLIKTDKATDNIELGVNVGLANVSFYDNDLGGSVLFKSSIDKLVSTYCTEEFKDILVTHGLKGLLFDEVVSI